MFLVGAERRRLDARVSERIEAALLRAQSGPLVPLIQAREFCRALTQFDFSQPRDIDAVVDWVLAQMQHGMTHTTNRRYFGLYNP